MNANTALKSILLMAANPRGTKTLRLHEEEREIKDRLRLTGGYGRTLINSTEATRTRDIQQAMLYFNPQIVHFSGHGAGQDGLVFEDSTGQEKLVSSEALADLFRLFSTRRVECVVLNACYSEFQAKAIARHVNYVVGMSQAIDDRAAIEFSVGFYSALGAGESIEFSYQLGCNAIQLEGIPEHLTPVLYRKGELLRFNSSNSELQNKSQNAEISRDTVTRGRRFEPNIIDPVPTNQSTEASKPTSQTIPVQAPQQHPEIWLLSNKDEIVFELINKLFDALYSPNVGVGIQKFEAIAHKSLFRNGQIEPSFRKNNFDIAFLRANLYKQPIEIIDSQSTGRTKLGTGANKEEGKEEKYEIARNDNLKGLYQVRIFFPADGRAAKISGLSF